MNKRGVSAIVATVALILLAFVAIGVISGVIVPFIKGNLEKSECFEYQDHFSFEREFGYNCYEVDGSDWIYAVSVRASGDVDAERETTGFQLVFYGNGNARSIEILDGSPTSSEIRMLNSGVGIFELPGAGEVRTYIFTSSEEFESVKIMAKLNSGDFCEMTDQIDFGGVVCTETTDTA